MEKRGDQFAERSDRYEQPFIPESALLADGGAANTTEDAGMNDIRPLLEQIEDPCFIHDLAEGRFIEVNRRGCELLGFTRPEILRMSVSDVETRFSLEMARIAWERTAAGVPSFFEGVARRKDGTTLPVDVSLGCFTCGAERMAFVVVRHSGSRSQREEALRNEHDRLFRLLDKLPAFTCLKSPNQTIPFANKRFRELFGDPEGKTCHQFFHGLGETCDPCPTRRVFETGLPERYEWTSSEGRCYEIDNIPFGCLEGTPLVLEFGIDVTERVRLWEALKRTNGELEAKVERRSKELQSKAEDLAETNAALRFLLRQRDMDREELNQSVLSNLQNRVFPYIESLRSTRLNAEQSALLERLDIALREMTSPFIRKLSSPLLCMTPTEIRVCDLVREGKGTKEISEILRLSEKAVHFHRQNIRAKLGIKGKTANLRAHLLALQ